ncbi:MAG: hypothetical protein IPG55_05220 [Saprospiraceae bacterium]|nr:hypothetical protein [Candidatus Defluviibacterium haderslevense]
MKGSLANGKPVSFLSKMAFLINPKDFSLYDKYARNSMNLILKSKVSGKKKAIDKTYDQFISKINVELEENESELMSQLKTLHNLPQKIETSYFENNPRIFIRRIYDKYLWLLSQDRNERRNSLDIITQQKFWNYYES